jgi:hypothetical protein
LTKSSTLPFFNPPLHFRVTYALIAGLAWWPIMEFAGWLGGSYGLWPWRDSIVAVGGWFLTWATGGVFSAFVLLPYLDLRSSHLKLRGALLLLGGMLSYYFAANQSSEQFNVRWLFPFSDWVRDKPDDWELLYVNGRLVYLICTAGVYGAAIIGLAARFVIPLKLSWYGWILVLVAGFVGGFLVAVGVDLDVDQYEGEQSVSWWPGHIAWELLVCLALYYGQPKAVRN